MRRAFSLLDFDGNGFIALETLKKALQDGENGLSNEELGTFLLQSGCKYETCFDFRKFVDEVAYGPVVLRTPPKKAKRKGKKK